MIHGQGFGKIILFGEHFVVYGLPAIVASLEQSTTATIAVTPGKTFKLIDHRPFVPGVERSSEKEHDYYMMARSILDYFGLPNNLSITLAGSLMVTNGGIGASAAAAVSIATALNNYFSLGYKNNELYAAALHGEKAVHGNPSGVDIAAALYGGITYFSKNNHPKKDAPMLPLSSEDTLFFTIIDSGQRCAIKETINDIATLRATNPSLFTSLCAAYNDLVNRAGKALQMCDTRKIGQLMLENQQLLDALTVSHPGINSVIEAALELGAYGAKLTGTGRGGLVIVLAPSKAVQQGIVRFFKQRSNHVMEATLQNPSSPENSTLKLGVNKGVTYA
ncbi:MAG: mevalonate kinase [Candidatus Babeliales bacterium]